MRNLTLLSSLALVLGTGTFLVVGCGSDASTVTDPAGDSGTLGGDAAVDASPAGDAGAPAKVFTISASVVGLQGAGLVLTDETFGDVTVPVQAGATQKVTLTTKAAAGAAYDVTVKTQPAGPPQRCEVTGGKGTVVAGDVTSITVNCTTLYTVGGTVSGLAGKDLVLENNGTADSVTVNANGQFSFPKPLATGSPWAVTVKANPTAKWQTCVVSVGDAGAASGTIANANVSNVDVRCTTNTYDVSVAVTGLAGTGLVLQNKGAADLPVAADGTYALASNVESGAEYDVTVLTQPTSPWQTCTVANGKANVLGQNVLLNVACTANKYKVGGTLSGLQGNGLVLQNNAGDDLTRNANQNGAFEFATTIASGQPYAVTVKTQPNGVADETCRVTTATASGVVAGADVTTVEVTCEVFKRVFVTSESYSGNLGGLDGADAKCQARADAANLPGTYRAWVSDSTGSPSTRFTQSAIPYKLVDGTLIAGNWADLVDGALVTTITKTEFGGAPPTTNFCGAGQVTVWTNTSANGTMTNASSSCSNWTGGGGGSIWGFATRTDSGWSQWCSGGACVGAIWVSPLYCFQQ